MSRDAPHTAPPRRSSVQRRALVPAARVQQTALIHTHTHLGVSQRVRLRVHSLAPHRRGSHWLITTPLPGSSSGCWWGAAEEQLEVDGEGSSMRLWGGCEVRRRPLVPACRAVFFLRRLCGARASPKLGALCRLLKSAFEALEANFLLR